MFSSKNSIIFVYTWTVVLLLNLTLTLTCQGAFTFGNDPPPIIRAIGGQGRINFGDSTNNGTQPGGFGSNPGTTAPKIIQPSPSSDEQLRRKLCYGQDSDYLYDQKSGRCYKIGSDEPCGVNSNMRFYDKFNSQAYGECDCLPNQAVPLVYHPGSKQCYFIYQQAYCRAGEWLSFNRRGEAVCSANKCLKSKAKTQPWTRNIVPDIVPFLGTGDCVKLHRPSPKCPQDQFISFHPNQVYPSCGPLSFDVRFIAPGGHIPCSPGSSRSITGQCSPDIDWDF